MKYAAVALALIGCGAAIPAVPSKGGPAWRELTSDHFTLWTDGSRDAAVELVQRMEDLRQAVVGVGFRGAGAQGRVLVIALRDSDEVGAYMPNDFAIAVASPSNSYIHQPLILLNVDTGGDFEIAAHELTHTISQVVIPKQPRWFAEGLASYFETIEIHRSEGKIDLGRAPMYRGEPVIQHHLISLASLFACTELACADAGFYATAWALFTYLTNQHGAELARYEQGLIASPGNHAQAWADAFGNVPLETLEQEMRAWLSHGSHQVLHFNVTLKTWPVAERALGDADVYTARGLLRYQFQGREDAAKVEIDAALALDKTHPLARFLEYRLAKDKIDPEIAKATAEAHPDDWRAWLLVADTAQSSDDAVAATRKSCELIAKNPAIAIEWQACATLAQPAQ